MSHPQFTPPNTADGYTPPVPGGLTVFLWRCAGSDEAILRRCNYSEHVKAACMGGIVLATGVLAAIAMTFAMWTIFSKRYGENSLYFAVPVGLIWGLMIFNLDRFIVSSTGKGDGLESISGSELRNALPRLLMALVIALVVSKPLEVQIFKRELDRAVADSASKLRTTQRGSNESAYVSELADISRLRSAALAPIEELQRRIQDLERGADAELMGTGVTKLPVCGRVCKQLRDQAAALKTERAGLEEQLAARLEELQARESEIKKTLQSQNAEDDTVIENMDGLLMRIQLLHQFAFWPSVLITLVFFFIEAAPIFFKLMIVKGPYDYLEEAEKSLIRARQGIEVVREWQPAPRGTSGPGAIHEQSIHHPSRAVIERQRTANEVQLSVEREAWRQYERQTLQEIERDPRPFFEEVGRPTAERTNRDHPDGAHEPPATPRPRA